MMTFLCTADAWEIKCISEVVSGTKKLKIFGIMCIDESLKMRPETSFKKVNRIDSDFMLTLKNAEAYHWKRSKMCFQRTLQTEIFATPYKNSFKMNK